MGIKSMLACNSFTCLSTVPPRNRRGVNKWRDYQLPKQILSWYCKTERLPEPVWMSDEEVMFEGQSFTLKQFGEHLCTCINVCSQDVGLHNSENSLRFNAPFIFGTLCLHFFVFS